MDNKGNVSVQLSNPLLKKLNRSIGIAVGINTAYNYRTDTLTNTNHTMRYPSHLISSPPKNLTSMASSPSIFPKQISPANEDTKIDSSC